MSEDCCVGETAQITSPSAAWPPAEDCTDVNAEVSGFIAEVHVTQSFHNPTKEPIEAVYVFPLPHGSAVHEMTMVVGRRRIVGLIKRRAAAREIYEQAILSGQTAALLEQERPESDFFTRSA